MSKLEACFALALAFAAPALAADQKVEIHAAAGRSIQLLERVGKTWFDKQTCFSCHHQVLPLLALDTARRHGLSIDAGLLRQSAVKAFGYMKNLDEAIQYYQQIDPAMSDGYGLLALNHAGAPPTLSTAVFARHIAGRQRREGYWTTIDVRPPQSQSPVTATAVGLRALQLYGHPKLAADTRARVTRAATWLRAASPRNTEERTFQLQGLTWAGAALEERRRLAAKLLTEQREDGGWAQLPGRQTDAYSTGQVLAAIHRAGGLPTENPAWQRGLRFLLERQKPDGSWHVATRMHPPAPVSPPYFESGFPHAKDQFISCAATAWATAALALALEEVAPNQPIPEYPELAPANVPSWAETALFGTTAELGALLDSGLAPNSQTAGGTSLLMMAVPDLEKVKLLVERGADVNARAKTRFTALMVAASHGGAAEVARLLLSRGAEVNPRPGQPARNAASALFLAAYSGDVETAALLLDKGADIERQMVLLGLAAASPLEGAAFQGDRAMVELLLRRGADANRTDPSGLAPLTWTVIGGFAEQARELVARGAKVNKVDKLGMTPLLYAATYYHGDTSTVAVLLASGANRSARNKQGQTALDLARKYGFADIARVLEQAGAGGGSR